MADDDYDLTDPAQLREALQRDYSQSGRSRRSR
jgi:hypothetical protein